MQKKITTIVILMIVVVGGYFLFARKTIETPSAAQLGEAIALRTYERAESPPVGSVSVPFTGSDRRTHYLSAAVDLNADGSFSSDEWLVKNTPVVPHAGQTHTYYFLLEATLSGRPRASVALNLTPASQEMLRQPTPPVAKSVVTETGVTSYEATDLLAMDTVTNPDQAMKGVSVALAEDTTSHVKLGVPDITQRPGECAPTTAADNLINLLNTNRDGAGNDLNPTELIDQLKDAMNWTAENGVLPDDFVAGKNQWAQDHGYPITTEKVGDANGVSTADAIKQAMAAGQAVELRIKFGNAQGQAVGGHMVTVTGFHQGHGQTFIDVSDPASPEGVDTYEIEGNQLSDYPFNGFTVLSWAFTQTWSAADQGASQTDTNASSQVSVRPANLAFTYNHAKPTCPQRIGELAIAGSGASYFNVVPAGQDAFPVWLNFPNGSTYDGGVQGFVNGPFPVEFPCQLDRYENQTQSQNFTVEVYDRSGQLLGEQEVAVKGTFTGF